MPRSTSSKPFKEIVTRAQRAFLLDLTQGLHPNTARFLLHLIRKSQHKWRRQERNPDYVPVHSKTIERLFRGAEWKKLVAAAPDDSDLEPLPPWQEGVSHADSWTQQMERDVELSRRAYEARSAAVLATLPYEVGRRAYRFRVRLDLIERYIQLGALQPGACEGAFVDLVSGRATTALGARTRLTTPTGKPYPAVIQHALRAIRRCPFDADAIDEHLDRLRREAAPHSLDHKLHRRWRVDALCYQAILKQHPVQRADGFWEYTPAYAPQSTGRITQMHGGLQNCSRAMKAAAYGRIAGLYNYDLADSHPRILRTLMLEAGINPSFLDEYLDMDAAKEIMADRLGIPVDVWKSIFYALFNGARVPIPYNALSGKPQGSVVRAFRKAYAGTSIRATSIRAAYSRFYKGTAHLRDEIDRYTAHLRTEALRPSRASRGGDLYVPNAAGMKLIIERAALESPERTPERARAERRLLAHALQGREALFIHTLTAQAADFGFEVVANEHDGLITLGEVPHEAVEMASLAADLPDARFIQKPFTRK